MDLRAAVLAIWESTSEVDRAMLWRVLANVHPSTADECWLWSGNSRREATRGKGRRAVIKMRIDGKLVGFTAARVVWEMFNGPIPADQEVCHSCDDPMCVNPAHLWLGTHQENMADAGAKGRLKWNGRCQQGHPLTADNLRLSALRIGVRRCLTCDRIYKREYQRTRRANLKKVV